MLVTWFPIEKPHTCFFLFLLFCCLFQVDICFKCLCCCTIFFSSSFTSFELLTLQSFLALVPSSGCVQTYTRFSPQLFSYTTLGGLDTCSGFSGDKEDVDLMASFGLKCTIMETPCVQRFGLFHISRVTDLLTCFLFVCFFTLVTSAYI